MNKSSKVHFLTAYVEYLLDHGVRSEEYYLGDASRFIRYLLANITEDDVLEFIEASARSHSYKTRLERTLRKFFSFASECLAIDNLPLMDKSEYKKPDNTLPYHGVSSGFVQNGRGDTI